MFRRFNDVSIRGKLVVIVAGAVAMLTTAVLVSVWISAWSEVTADVRNELLAARKEFITSESEHLHESALEATAIAGSDDLLRLLATHDRPGACAWIGKLLSGKHTLLNPAVNPEDSFDLVGVMESDGRSLATALSRREPCGRRELQWALPLPSNAKGTPEITNWESDDETFYELVEVPVYDDKDRIRGILVLGFELSDAFAAHVKEHTGQETVLWHEEGAEYHLLGTSDASLKDLLIESVTRSGNSSEIEVESNRGRYAVLDAAIEDRADIIRNPSGLHLALMQSLDEKFRPFRRLEYSLAALACAALLLGLLVGMFLSRPIAMPLINLAHAAENVAQGKLESAGAMLQQHPERMDARDEIGVLGRAFLRMIDGLKERLAMSAFVSQATFEHIRRQTPAGMSTERMSLAIMFSDVRQFTNFSEGSDPEAVIQLLNQVLSIEAEIVKEHQGDIDKFVGDAVIAWFAGSDRCVRAVKAANRMVEELQARFGGRAGTRIGVGLHVGEVVVGPVGSRERKDYTAIGSVVNMAARLCSSAQPGQILVSRAVAEEIGSEACLKPLPPIKLKGFSAPVEVFEANAGEPAKVE